MSHFRVFGCTAYVHIKSDQRKQLESHTHKCVFIGYPSNFKGWRFFNPDTRKEVISNSAVFDERAHSESFKTNVDLHVPGLTESVDPVGESSELHLPSYLLFLKSLKTLKMRLKSKIFNLHLLL